MPFTKPSQRGGLCTSRVHGIAAGGNKGGAAEGRKEGRFPVEGEGFWLAEGTEKLERGRMWIVGREEECVKKMESSPWRKLRMMARVED